MKKVLFMALAVMGAGSLFAQMKAGTIVYERRVNMHRTIQNEQMRAMMPEFRDSKHMLVFSDSVSVFKTLPEDETPDPFGGGGNVRVIMRGGSDGGELYKNFALAKSVQSSELAGKNYLIVDTIRQQPWKLVTESKEILGHTCHKAVRKMSVPAATMRVVSISASGTRDSTSNAAPATREVEVVAWYAEDIITPAGPDSHGQLPGAILQLDIDNGQTVYTAKEITAKTDAKILKEPKKGKEVTQAEFMKIQRELMNSQMQSMPMGGGTRFSFGN